LFKAVISIVAPNVKSGRRQQARMFAQEAFGCLYSHDDHRTHNGVKQIIDPDADVMRISVLEHLGRLQVESGLDDADILSAARWLNDRFKNDVTFTVRRAVELLRLLREEIAARIYLDMDHHPMERLLPLMEADA
jgi:hypothetical protein